MQSSFAKAGMLSLLLCSAGISALAQQPGSATKSVKRSSTTTYNSTSFNTELHFVEDSTKNPVQSYITYRDRSLYVMTLTGEKLVELYVDGHQVPADSFHVYQPLVERLQAQIKRDKEQAAKDREQAERDREQAGRDREQAERDREQAEKDKLQAERDREQADRDRQQADLAREKAGDEREQVKRDREQADRDRQQADKDKKQAERDREQAGRDREQAERDRAQAEKDREQAEKDRAFIEQLIKDIIKDGLAPNADDLTVELGNEEFYVNGKKQPAEVFARYKARYIPNSKAHISVHKNSHSLMISR